MRIAAVGLGLLLSAAIMTAGQNGNDLYQQGLAREKPATSRARSGSSNGSFAILGRINPANIRAERWRFG